MFFFFFGEKNPIHFTIKRIHELMIIFNFYFCNEKGENLEGRNFKRTKAYIAFEAKNYI